MIAACFTADFYCDVPDCTSKNGFHMGEAQITGWTWASCARQARKDGRLIGKDKNTAICPRCREAGKKLKDVQAS